MDKELKIVAPDGYEIDKEQSTFERIVFKKKEPKLPESWAEFCSMTKREGFFISANCDAQTVTANSGLLNPSCDRNILESVNDCNAHLALMQLHRLRDCYRQGWKPTADDIGYAVTVTRGDRIQVGMVLRFLSFQDKWLAIKFSEHFRELILTAKELLR